MPSRVYKWPITHLISRPLMTLVTGQIITALAGLVYGKLTAIYIAPAVWGDYSLLLVAMTLLHSVFITPTLQSFKAALGQFPQQQVIPFYNQLLLRIYLILGVLTLLAGLYDQHPIFGLIWLAAFGQGMYQFGFNYLNSLGQHRLYSLTQAAYAIGMVLTFGFVIIRLDQRTVDGLWLALTSVNIVFAIVSVWPFIRTNSVSFILRAPTHSLELRRSYRHYVGPLVSLAFWGWLINYADRYLIRLYLTEADVGQYGMGYSLGSKLLLLVSPLLAFLSPQVLQLRATNQSPQTANLLIRRYLIQYVTLAGAGCVLFYTGHEWIGHLFLSDRYEPAFVIGPIVAVGYLFLTSIHLFELKWYAFGQTHFILWHNVLGAFLNVGFNLLLIPRLGIMGAALATLLGFIGQFLLAMWLFTSARRNNP